MASPKWGRQEVEKKGKFEEEGQLIIKIWCRRVSTSAPLNLEKLQKASKSIKINTFPTQPWKKKKKSGGLQIKDERSE